MANGSKVEKENSIIEEAANETIKSLRPAKIRQLGNYLSASLWFLPSLIVLGSILLAYILIEIDTRVGGDFFAQWPRIFGTGAEGARSMLSAIASSMITVVGITFSITIVALSLASSQFSPRILRNFMGDRISQMVLGIFSGIFTYCLIVLRTIRDPGEGDFVPSLSVTMAVLLALLSIYVLILFIHHIASSIHASSLIAMVAEETIEAINDTFPEELGQERETDVNRIGPQLDQLEWTEIPSQESGYIQNIDAADLLDFARRRGVIIRMEHGVGEFVVEGLPLVSISPARTTSSDLMAELTNEVNGIFAISRYRTVSQDIAFGIRQLVDISLRALSPGINDPTTAITCIDYLTAILSRLALRRDHSVYRFDGSELRLIARVQTFERLVHLAFNQIRQNGAGNVAVVIRLLKAMEMIGRIAQSQSRRNLLWEQVQLLVDVARQKIPSDHDLQKIIEQQAEARQILAPPTHNQSS